MRPYLIVNALVYTLVLVGHAARVLSHGAATLAEPVFAVSTLICIGLLGWTLKLLRARP